MLLEQHTFMGVVVLVNGLLKAQLHFIHSKPIMSMTNNNIDNISTCRLSECAFWKTFKSIILSNCKECKPCWNIAV